MATVSKVKNEYCLKSKEAVESLVLKYCGQFGDLVLTAIFSAIPENTNIKATVNSDCVEIVCRFSSLDKLRREISKSWSLLSSLIKRGTILSHINNNEATLKANIRLLAYYKLSRHGLSALNRLAV
jgi:hypothetical protein